MKIKLFRYGIGVAIASLIAVWVMYTEGLFDGIAFPTDVVLMILCDAFFVSGILFTLFGALMWIASTGFFDSLSYAVKIALHNFIPTHKWERKSFYDYKMEKAEKRGGVTLVPVIVGAVFLLVSAVFLIIWSAMV